MHCGFHFEDFVRMGELAAKATEGPVSEKSGRRLEAYMGVEVSFGSLGAQEQESHEMTSLDS